MRWTVVEDDDTPEFEDGERNPPDRRPDAADHGPGAHDRLGAVHGRRRPAGPARGRRPSQPARERQGDVARPRRARGPYPACAACSAPATAPSDGDRCSATPRTSPAPRSPPSPPTPPTRPRRRSRRSRRVEALGSSRHRRGVRAAGLPGGSDRARRGDADAALAAAEVMVEAEYLAPAQLHNSLEPHAAVADWREDGLTAVELDPGHLRRARDRGRGVRARSRAGPRDLRVHGRRVRLEVRRRAAGHPGGRALAPQRPAGAAREQPPRGEPGRRLPHAGAHGVRIGRRATGASRRSRRRPSWAWARAAGLPRPRAR